ncbi:MAG: DUF1287 domain-containing protein [Candidatus Pacebacteria bacterium]|jgi:hypothetical protein|nr:DUF1287 domain-containing protein [Candidatus Paceibacterota bacterium]
MSERNVAGIIREVIGFSEKFDDRTDWKTKVIDDDFTKNIVKAAVEQTTKKVIYDPAYFQIDYPNGDIPSNRGVCTDVIIRAYRSAGVDLQKEVHEDMVKNFGLYPDKWGLAETDTNIDHRRVPNLQVFFRRFGEELEISKNPGSYRPSDIVTWDMPSGRPHIGLVSNFSKNGVPLIVHNIGAGPKIDDVLFDYKISGHYRYLCK